MKTSDYFLCSLLSAGSVFFGECWFFDGDRLLGAAFGFMNFLCWLWWVSRLFEARSLAKAYALAA